MSKKVTDEFPQANGRYWYLYWIDKIFYENKNFKVDFYFVNTNESNGYLRNFNLDKIHKIRVPVEYLCDYHIGTICDTNFNNKIKKNEGFSKDSFSVKPGIYRPTKASFPLIDYPFFPNEPNLNDVNFSYFTYNSNYSKHPVIVTPYCLAEYLLFRSTSLTKKIFSGNILAAFHFNNLKILKDKTSNEVIVELPYDKKKLKNENDAITISKYLFLKNKAGIKMIKSIYSSIQQGFRDNSARGQEVSSFLNLNFEFGGYSGDVEGKLFYRLKDTGKVFLASKIIKLNYTEKPYSIDRIVLIPIDEKINTTNSTVNPNNTKPVKPNITGLNLYLNPPTRPHDDVREVIATNQIDPIDINVEVKPIIIDESYGENFIPLEFDVDGGSRNTDELDEYIGELITIQQEVEKVYEEIIYIENLKYFEKVVEYLNEREDIQINYDPLNIGGKYPISILGIRQFKIDIVEVIWNQKYLYLVEFGSGNIGVFRGVDATNTVDSEDIVEMLEEFVKINPEEAKYKLLWTIVYNERKEFAQEKGVKIERGIEHTRESKDIPTKVTADRIYNDRILKIR